MTNPSSPNEVDLEQLYSQAKQKSVPPHSIKSKTISAARKAEHPTNSMFSWLNLTFGVIATASTALLISLLTLQTSYFQPSRNLNLVEIEYHDFEDIGLVEDAKVKLFSYAEFRRDIEQKLGYEHTTNMLATLENTNMGMSFRTCHDTQVKLSGRLVGHMRELNKIDKDLIVGGNVSIYRDSQGHIMKIELTEVLCESARAS